MNPNKRFPVLVAASVVVVFTLWACFQLYPPSMRWAPSIHPIFQDDTELEDVTNRPLDTTERSQHYAYATSVCSIKEVENSLVLIHSLKTSKTPHAVLVVLDSSVSDQHEGLFRALGASVIRAHKEDCNVAKMSLWSLTTYDKIAYIDSGSVINSNFDDIFDLPANSVLMQHWPHYVDKVMVLKPDSYVYDRLLRQARNEQSSTDGVLPSYLTSNQLHPITDASIKMVGDKTSAPVNAKLLVFSGDIKPWNWYTFHDQTWLGAWDPDSFWQWRHHRNEIEYLYNGSKGLMNSIQRTESVCNGKHLSKTFPIIDKFSVLLSTYNPERIDHVTTLIRHLATSDMVHTIYLTWHNPKLEVNKELRELQEGLKKPLVILSQKFDSLNNRFNPIEGLETAAVYILDDDIVVSIPDLEFTFEVWKNRKNSLVGHFPRFHQYNVGNGKSTYAMADAKRPNFSIILTKSMFVRSEYLFAYTCLMEPAMHEYVDDHLNCEDIGFSFMVSGLTASANAYVTVKSRIRDYGLSKGISTNSNHINARGQCVTDMISTYWKGQDPTEMSGEMVSQLAPANFARGSWEELASEVTAIEKGI